MDFIKEQQDSELSSCAKQFKDIINSLTKEQENNYSNLLYKYNINNLIRRQKEDEILMHKQKEILLQLEELKRVYEETLTAIIEKVKHNAGLIAQKLERIGQIVMPNNENVSPDLIAELAENYKSACQAYLLAAKNKMEELLAQAQEKFAELKVEYDQSTEGAEYKSRKFKDFVRLSRNEMEVLKKKQQKNINILTQKLLQTSKECEVRLQEAIQDKRHENFGVLTHTLEECLKVIEAEHRDQLLFQQSIIDLFELQGEKTKSVISELKRIKTYLVKAEKINIT